MTENLCRETRSERRTPALQQTAARHTKTGGVVGHGESYEDNARRELEEEMGVKAAPRTSGDEGVDGGGGGGGRADGEIRHCFSFHYKDDRTDVWGDAWDCVWGGEIVPQPVRLPFFCFFWSAPRVAVQFFLFYFLVSNDREGDDVTTAAAAAWICLPPPRS